MQRVGPYNNAGGREESIMHKFCDNCGGRGHIAATCSTPPNCNCCGSYGHIKAECTKTDRVCDLCGKIGHLSMKCRMQHANSSMSDMYMRGKRLGKKACFCCGSLEHAKVDCPSKDKECRRCGMIGHLAVTCEN